MTRADSGVRAAQNPSGGRVRRGARSAKPTAVDAPGPMTLVRDPLRALLFMLMIVTISRVHLHYPLLSALRPVLLLSVGAIGYAYLHPQSLTSSNVLSRWPMRMVLLIAVLGCVSAPFGLSLGNSALFILDSFSKTLAFAFLVALSIRNGRDLYTMVWAFVLSAGILSFFAVFVFKLEPAGAQAARLAELYTYDSNDLGVLLMIGLPLTLLLLTIDRGLKRWLLGANLILISAAMARSGSRGGFLGLVAVGVASLFLVNGVSAAKRVAVLVVAAVALAFAAPPGYWKQMGTIVAPKGDYNYSSVDGRTALMKRGLGYMSKYPLTGIGIWNFAKAECSISPKIQNNSNIGAKCIAPHNSVIQAAAELGIPGLIAWPSLLLGLIGGPLRLRKKLPASWRRGDGSHRFLYASTTFFPIAMCGFAVTSFFVTFAFADPIYLMAGMTTGLYAVVAARRAHDRSGHTAVAEAAKTRSVEGWRVKQSGQRLLGLGPRPAGAS